MLTTIASYNLVSRDLERSLENTARQPFVSRETDYYLETISTISSVDEFINDDRLFTYAMTAHGMSDMTYAKAFMRKVLEEGIDDPDSFANNLADTRYREFAATFNFARYGATATAFTRTAQGTVDNYVRQALETDQGEQNQGVRLALYFQRKAPELNSVYGILADRALLTVAQTALGIPSEASVQDIDRQAETLAKRIDIEDFKDPEKLERFIDQFAALWDLSSPTTTSVSAPTVTIGSPLTFGISDSVLSQLQNLKLGGR